MGNNGLGILPPQNREMEGAVLGAILIEKDALNSVASILRPEDFYVEAHQLIYNSILELSSNSLPIDILTVSQQLRATGKIEQVGGAYYVTQLTNAINSSAHVETHARVVAECALKRELIRLTGDIHSRCFRDTEDVFALKDELETTLSKINTGLSNGNISVVREIIRDVLEDVVKAMDLPDGLTGVPSGFGCIDRITGGFQKSDLIIIAARPAMGKTALVVSAARNASVDFKKPVAIFSLEMGKKQLVQRLITAEVDHLELSTDRLRRGKIDHATLNDIHRNIGKLIDSKIFIDDTASLSLSKLRAKAFELKRKHSIEMIVVDYLQLMTVDSKKGMSREQEIATISRGLKNLAKDLDIPVIALSQLSRAVESRPDKRPMLSDLRESGSIEQDADMIVFLYRPEYYGIMEDETGASLAGIGEFIIAKHRNGALAEIILNFIAKKTKFIDPTGKSEFVSSVHSF